jgi:hypothetical protein
MTTTRRRTSRSPRREKTPRLAVLEPRLVRLPRVRSAQKRIESGYYDRHEVRDRLAVAVLEALLTD